MKIATKIEEPHRCVNNKQATEGCATHQSGIDEVFGAPNRWLNMAFVNGDPNTASNAVARVDSCCHFNENGAETLATVLDVQ